MAKATKEATLIEKINDAFPQLRATPYSEFTGRDVAGIWFRGSECATIDGELAFDYHNLDQQVHPKLDALLKKAGWYAEPYDSGTWVSHPL